MTGPAVTVPAGDHAQGRANVTSVADDALARAVWQAELDELLRGVAHALSNRVATISAAAYMASGGEALDPAMVAALSAESERLETLLGDLRLLPAPLEPGAEPLLLDELARHALALHRHHLPLRDVPVIIDADATAQPAYGNPARVLHLLLLVLTAARAVAMARRRRHESVPPMITCSVSGDAQRTLLVAQVAGASDVSAPEQALRVVHAIDVFARALGGTASIDAAHGAVQLALPTLSAARATRTA
ncbi:MAG: hypothetical protein MUF00_08840 [Gemmatimonadaceae bacterium]|jgi:hypothetical protein|nr:hypothetical protein [Gemmatimonadaceae bacterium]